MKKREFTQEDNDKIISLYKEGYTRDDISYQLNSKYNIKIGHRYVQKIINNVKTNPEIEQLHIETNRNKQLLNKQLIIENKPDVKDIIKDIERDYKLGLPIPKIQRKYHVSNKTFNKIISDNYEDIKERHNINLYNKTRNYTHKTHTELNEILTDYANGISIKTIMKKYNIGYKNVKKFVSERYDYDDLKNSREIHKNLKLDKNKKIIYDIAPATTFGNSGETLDEFFGREILHPNSKVYGRIDFIKEVSLYNYKVFDEDPDENGNLNFNDLKYYEKRRNKPHETNVITKIIRSKGDYMDFLDLIRHYNKEIDVRKMPVIRNFETNKTYYYIGFGFPEYEQEFNIKR